ncbi:hypothetical protein T265_00904 [Opisthorchis viverrini]|uniref:Uncharacterized protein n=1 Tax=Opisthorchis viverrini TaxID=6198 RepID=A0A075A1K3_OPIVI|nr:hypothetical protein T265_00904 [Opisthorchis viverrini]KER33216.1 hypothetical protein T265_00904 [Opisthorchis viverrini]
MSTNERCTANWKQRVPVVVQINTGPNIPAMNLRQVKTADSNGRYTSSMNAMEAPGDSDSPKADDRDHFCGWKTEGKLMSRSPISKGVRHQYLHIDQSNRQTPTVFEKHTHLQIILLFTRDLTESLIYDIRQLNVLHTDCLMF